MLHEIFILLAMFSSTPVTARAARDVPTEKVWTNQDLRALRATSPISIIGRIPRAEAEEPGIAYQPYVKEYVKEKDADWYADRIEDLRQTIADADAEIETVEEIRKTGEGITGGVPLAARSVGITPEATVEILEGEKSAVAEEIEGLQDEARENEIPAGAWR